MALRSCYECNKEISTKVFKCPQCSAPQNPVSDWVEKALDRLLVYISNNRFGGGD
jgi:hypothetical protein